MSNNIRIRTNPNEFKSKHIKMKLEQDFDFLEVLSLNISQEDVYRRFCSDYGVVVGRVIMNSGVGVPNAKVSIFIPISDEDALNDTIVNIYPFTSISDTDEDGKRYNLLPKTEQFECHTPVGSFPTKLEILDNDELLDVHCKYYKFTATTNDAGDFMLFGVPVGNHFLNVDVDMSDIGIFSQRPYDFIKNGQSKELFETTTKFKFDNDIDKLPQIKGTQTSVNVRPFWGDLDQCEVGITRIDYDTKYNIEASAIFMGSIFGDNEKNSINKRCKPRKDLGRISETTTNAGTIEMLRKTLDNQNEIYNVNGGRVIDEDGTWAYQVPMNLDYKITDEFGNLVPTDNPNKGIPTRARVRFRIGMDNTGGEGRLRVRAKHLVPNNPKNNSEADYSFNEQTSDSEFRDLYWNQIYSVKNYITRYQASEFLDLDGEPEVNDRRFIGIKDVDDSVGTHNPFPFNRIDTDLNPLYSIICTIISVISSLIVLINLVLIFLLNLILIILNAILQLICEIVWNLGKVVCRIKHAASSEKRKKCQKEFCIAQDSDGSDCGCKNVINYIPCLTVKCGGDIYGPGCQEKIPFSDDNRKGWERAKDERGMNVWPDSTDDNGFNDTVPPGDAGWAACISIQIAEALNVWEFDFYNDWVNGTLYSFLLKYKTKSNGVGKFCEYDCGQDTNDDGKDDNKCRNNVLLDSLVIKEGVIDEGVKQISYTQIDNGLIKKFENELYYASMSKVGEYLLYATDIISLGAIFDCDWLGNPKIQQGLIPTTYNIPPTLDEFDSNGDKTVSGIDSVSLRKRDSLLFNITCLGIFTDNRTNTNTRRICEIGLGLDEDRTDDTQQLGCTNNGEPDLKIDNCDIDRLLIRDAFTKLNNPQIDIQYNSTNPSNHALFDEKPYDDFRNFTNATFSQPKGNSYFFYFGLKPGKTALEKMNERYFESCNKYKKNDLLITGIITNVDTFNGSNGSIDITVDGGTEPYTYTWSNGATTEDISNLPAGTYTVFVEDKLGLTGSATFLISQPSAIFCSVSKTDTSAFDVNDGTITVNVNGGEAEYTINISGPTNQTITTNNTNTVTFTNLPKGEYDIEVSDSSNPTQICENSIEITAPVALTIETVVVDNVKCFGSSTGVIKSTYITGNPPITFVTAKTSDGVPILPNTAIKNGLEAGDYTVTATDSTGLVATQTVTVTQPPKIVINGTIKNVSCNGSNDGRLTVSAQGGVPPYTYEWSDSQGAIISTSSVANGLSGGIYNISVKDKNECEELADFLVLEPEVINISDVTKTNPTQLLPNSGTITVGTVTGGNPGQYTYELYNELGSLIKTQATNVFTNLGVGVYNVKVTDNKGCESNTVSKTLIIL